MSRSHTDRQYDQKLQDLQKDLLRMAETVEKMIGDAVTAFLNRDRELAERTILHDRSVNRAELAVDELCLVILARWQPMASDLRFITRAMKMVTDLERIGDLAVNICERALSISSDPQPAVRADIESMAKDVEWMVSEAMRAFVQRDTAKARAVIERDDKVDEVYARVFSQILGRMCNENASIPDSVQALSVAKWLERIADHATNVSEQLLFMVDAEEVRHPGKLEG